MDDAAELLVTTYHWVARQHQLGAEGKWNQSSWRCESGLCFAGWLVVLSGESEWLTDAEHELGELLLALSQDPPRMAVRMGDVHTVTAHTRARRLLGVYEDGRHESAVERLFDVEATLPDIRACITHLVGLDPEHAEPDPQITSTFAKSVWDKAFDAHLAHRANQEYLTRVSTPGWCPCPPCVAKRATRGP